MSDSYVTRSLDRYTQFTELGAVVHRLLQRSLPVFASLVTATVAFLFFTENPGWLGFLWMGLGTMIALMVWREKGIGIPLVPIIAIQHCITFGTPILFENSTIAPYPEAFITKAGWEVGLFLVVMTAAWRIGMEFFSARPTDSYVLKAFDTDDGSRRSRIGIGLILAVTAYNVLDSMELISRILEELPAGTYSIVSALIKAVTMAGYFLVAMNVGSGEAHGPTKALFWSTLVINALIMTSGLLLSSASNLVASVVIGLFWGGGRMPWRFLAVTAVILAFLHLGKFEMRERYWGPEGTAPAIGITELHRHYGDWIDASYRTIVASEPTDSVGFGPQKSDTLTMVDRVNNLQNLLYVINAVEVRELPLLGGATYSLIPPLLVPRMLWPDKPRAHEGQVLLNVHFERQSLSATFQTYIAWGLLPEAYGNFGALWGAGILGLVAGLLFARIETATACKPLLSLEGLVTFAFFISLAVSFEMVASVLVTSLFQSIIIIAMACVPFVHRAFLVRPETHDVEDAE